MGQFDVCYRTVAEWQRVQRIFIAQIVRQRNKTLALAEQTQAGSGPCQIHLASAQDKTDHIGFVALSGDDVMFDQVVVDNTNRFTQPARDAATGAEVEIGCQTRQLFIKGGLSLISPGGRHQGKESVLLSSTL